MSRAVWVVTLALLAGGCGASTAQITRARSARYQADFDEVWTAVQTEVRSHYRNIKQEDGTLGVIISEWTPIEKKADATGTDNINVTAGAKTGSVNAGELFQVRVRILEGGPPWQIVVEGEAAEYRPSFASLRPYPRGAIDEPHWVQGRIDEIYLGVYQRLEKRAVTITPAPPAEPPPSKPEEGNPPPIAPEVGKPPPPEQVPIQPVDPNP